MEEPRRSLGSALRVGGERSSAVAEEWIASGGDLADGLDVISDLMGDDWQRSEAIQRLASQLAAIDLRRARALAAEAAGAQRQLVLAGIVPAIADGDPDTALEVVEALPEGRLKLEGLGRVLRSLGRRDPRRATALWQQLAMPARGALAAEVIASLSATDRDAARVIAEQVLDDVAYREHATSDFLISAVAPVDTDLGLRAAGLRRVAWQRRAAITTIAVAAAREDPTRAVEIAMRLDDPEDRDRGLSAIAERLATTALDRSLAIAAQIVDRRIREMTLRDVATAIGADRTDVGLGIAMGIADEALQRESIVKIAIAVAERYPPGGMEVIERFVKDGGCYDDQLIPVVAKVDPERALRCAGDIEETWQRDHALEAVAVELARRGSDRAFDVAQDIADPHQRTGALTAVACSLERLDVLCDLAYESSSDHTALLAFAEDVIRAAGSQSELGTSVEIGVLAAIRESTALVRAEPPEPS